MNTTKLSLITFVVGAAVMAFAHWYKVDYLFSPAQGFFDSAMAQNPKPQTYPPDAVGMVRAVNEIGFKSKMIGGAMVGLQGAAIKMQLGPLLNGWVNYDYWEPFPKLIAPGVEVLLKKYQARAQAEGVDPLGYYMGPWAYAQLQVIQQAVEATKSLDDQKLADYIRSNTMKTVLGDFKFGANGEWAESRMLTVQYHSIKGNGLEQFRTVGTQTLLSPEAYSTGEVIYPFAKARE